MGGGKNKSKGLQRFYNILSPVDREDHNMR